MCLPWAGFSKLACATEQGAGAKCAIRILQHDSALFVHILACASALPVPSDRPVLTNPLGSGESDGGGGRGGGGKDDAPLGGSWLLLMGHSKYRKEDGLNGACAKLGNPRGGPFGNWALTGRAVGLESFCVLQHCRIGRCRFHLL